MPNSTSGAKRSAPPKDGCASTGTAARADTARRRPAARSASATPSPRARRDPPRSAAGGTASPARRSGSARRACGGRSRARRSLHLGEARAHARLERAEGMVGEALVVLHHVDAGAREDAQQRRERIRREAHRLHRRAGERARAHARRACAAPRLPKRGPPSAAHSDGGGSRSDALDVRPAASSCRRRTFRSCAGSSAVVATGYAMVAQRDAPSAVRRHRLDAPDDLLAHEGVAQRRARHLDRLLARDLPRRAPRASAAIAREAIGDAQQLHALRIARASRRLRGTRACARRRPARAAPPRRRSRSRPRRAGARCRARSAFSSPTIATSPGCAAPSRSSIARYDGSWP